ncbi:unnamed protein product [Calypogeia fissa]
MMMKNKESVRRFLQRFNRVSSKIDPAPADNMKMRWFISALPKKMGISVCQAHPTTLEEAVEAAQSYKSADISSKTSRKKKKKRYDTSDSSSSEETSSEFEEKDSSSSDSDSSSSEEEDKKRKKSKKKKRATSMSKLEPVKSKVEVTVAVKDQGVEAKVDELSNQLKAMSVHFAGLQPYRRKPPMNREHVWCVKCGQFGHIPLECPNTSVRVHFVGEEIQVINL